MVESIRIKLAKARRTWESSVCAGTVAEVEANRAVVRELESQLEVAKVGVAN